MLSPSACAFSRSISSQIEGLVAVKVENTRVRRGSWLAAAIRPCITLAISAGSRPSRFSNWYSKPPLVDSPMIGGRLNGNTLAERICCDRAEDAPDHRLRAVRGGRAIGERLEPEHHEGGIRFVAAIEQREADDREHALDLRHRPDQVLDLLHHGARARHRRAVRQLHGDEERALVLFRQEAGRRANREQPDADARRDDQPPPTARATRSSRCTTAA